MQASDTQRLLREMPRAQASIWPGAGHAMHWEQPQRFAQEIVRFADTLAPAASAAGPA